MPSAVSPNPRVNTNEPDELDRMLDYDNAVEDFLNDIPMRNDDTHIVPEPPRDEDQEVQVKRKRKPIAKLDEDRLLSEAGIPRLRRITKSKLKFRGKHHEYSDISKVLSTYQLWLDDLYPRAKFRDALTIVEKLGHSKRMQVMRKAWLDSTKPNRIDPEAAEEETNPRANELRGTTSPEPTLEQDNAGATGTTVVVSGQDEQASSSKDSEAHHQSNEPDDDELDALLAEQHDDQPKQAHTRSKVPFEEEEDDLDALLAEQVGGEHAGQVSSSGQPRLSNNDNDFADEEEAMAAMGGAW